MLIDGKGLTLVGDGPTRPLVPPLHVLNTPAQSTTVLRALEVRGNSVDLFIGSAALSISNCTGAVMVEDCLIVGLPGQAQPQFGQSLDGHHGLRIEGSPATTIQRSEIHGGDGVDVTNNPFPFPGTTAPASRGGSAVVAIDARIAIQASTLTGGDGGSGFADGAHGRNAGHAVDARESSRIWTTGSTFTGGTGGAAGIGGTPGASGHGLIQDGPLATLRDVDTTFVGGPGAADLVILDGTQASLPGVSVVFVATAPARSEELAEVTVSGPPGTLFGVFFGFGVGFLPANNFKGVFLPSQPFFQLFVSTIPPSGLLEVPFVAPSLAGIADGYMKVDQVLSSQPPHGLVIGSASAYVQVESGF